MPILTSYDVTTSDCAAVFAIMCAFGHMFLIAATDGRSVHGLGLLGRLSARQRIIGLVGANLIFVLAGLVCFMLKGVSPIDLAHGAKVWWTNMHGFDPFSFAIAVFTFWTLFSPLQSLLAIYLIRRGHQRSLQLNPA